MGAFFKCRACGAFNQEGAENCQECGHALACRVGEEKCACAHCREAREEKTRKIKLPPDEDEATLTTYTDADGLPRAHLLTG